ncbi:myosin regulatory light chain 2B, cardiac muscle isoform-like [Sebastes fasciatus]|uniref:myosin regulatory light chain 2B, cardiac muscle isoform-like n=1 Tax=Sebastes fasciatus TaxID=394691 RepID=UPI003D9EE44C
MFELNQIQEFKEAFTIIDESDLSDLSDLCCSGCCFTVTMMMMMMMCLMAGHLKVGDDDLDEMTRECSGPLNSEKNSKVNQMFTKLDVAGNLDYKNLCYVITHKEDKERE